MKRILRLFASQEFVLLVVIVAIMAAVGWINPRFLAERNLQSIFLGNAYIAVAAIGMSMVIISGNIDISVGSLIGVLATLSGTLAVNGVPVVLAWILPIGVSILVTTFMGILVAYLRIPSIVVTLGMMSVLKGALIVATGGTWINDLPDGFQLAQMRPREVEAESHPLPLRARREEGIEGGRRRVGVHAGAVVVDEDLHMIADAIEVDADAAAALAPPAGLGRVGDELAEDLAEHLAGLPADDVGIVEGLGHQDGH